MIHKYNKSLFLLLIMLFSLASCSEYNSEKNIDYEQLQHLEPELLFEVGSYDSLILGKISELIINADSTFLIFDSGKHTIDYFGADGDFIETVSERGNGPGELPPSLTIIGSSNETFIVRHAVSGQYDYFKKEHSGRYYYEKSSQISQSHNRIIQLIGQFDENKFLSISSEFTSFIFDPSDQIPHYKEEVLVVTDSLENILQDSLQVIKTPNPIAIRNNGTTNLFPAPSFQYRNRVRILNNEFYAIASPDNGVITIFNRSHEPINEITINLIPERVTRSDVSQSIGEMPSAYRRVFFDRLDKTPPIYFNDYWISTNQILLLKDKQEGMNRYVIFNNKGMPLGRFSLSAQVEVKQISESRIYTRVESEDAGEIIRVYKMPVY